MSPSSSLTGSKFIYHAVCQVWFFWRELSHFCISLCGGKAYATVWRVTDRTTAEGENITDVGGGHHFLGVVVRSKPPYSEIGSQVISCYCMTLYCSLLLTIFISCPPSAPSSCRKRHFFFPSSKLSSVHTTALLMEFIQLSSFVTHHVHTLCTTVHVIIFLHHQMAQIVYHPIRLIHLRDPWWV